MDARRRDIDTDSVAADVIYHSSQNGQPIPLIPGGSLWFDPTTGDLERAAVGTHIYNEWLATRVRPRGTSCRGGASAALGHRRECA